MIPETKLDALIVRHAAIERELSGQTDRESYVRLSREFAELNPLVDAIKRYRAAAEEISGLQSLIADPATEPDMPGTAPLVGRPRLTPGPLSILGQTPLFRFQCGLLSGWLVGTSYALRRSQSIGSVRLIHRRANSSRSARRPGSWVLSASDVQSCALAL
jgi:hypothetical protein